MGRKKKDTPCVRELQRPSGSFENVSTGQREAMRRVLAARESADIRENEQGTSRQQPAVIAQAVEPEILEFQACERSPESPGSVPPSPYDEEHLEEYPLRPMPRRGNPPIAPVPAGNVVYGPNDQKMYYAMHCAHSGTSRAEILRNERLHRVLENGNNQSITWERDLKPFYNEVLREYDLKRMYYCPGCWRRMGRKDRCRNRLCSYVNLKCKRSGPRRRVELIHCNVAPQLRDVMEEFIDEMKEVHDYIHTAKANGTLTDKKDIRYYPRYANNIETPADFHNHKMTVNLTIASDGYRPKRLSKAEFWPLYARVDGVNHQDRDAYRNSIVSAVLFTRKTHILHKTDDFFARLIEELNDLDATPMVVTDSTGIRWTLCFRVNAGVMDMAGQRDFFQLPRWSSEYGCGKCVMPGARIGRSRSWASNNIAFPRRTAADIRRDAVVGVNGLICETPAMQLFTPADCPGDSLHCVSEGIALDRCKDLIDKGRFTELNLTTHECKAVKDSVSRIVNYTYSGAYILSLEDRGSCSGAEKQQLCNVLFPLATSHCLSLRAPSKCVAAAMLVGFWWLSRTLEWHFSLDDATITLIKDVSADVQFLHEQLNPQSTTLKAHYFYVHAIQEELSEYGSIFAWTAAFSESWHRSFQIKHDQSSTNCNLDTVRRYLCRKAVYRLFRKVALRNRHPDYLRLLAETENAHIERNPVYLRVNNNVYIPEGSTVNPASLNDPDCVGFARNCPPGYVLSSRLVIGETVHSSQQFWSRTDKSQQHLVFIEYVDHNQRTIKTFASIILFASNAQGRSYALLKVFITESPFDALTDVVQVRRQPHWRVAYRLLNAISLNNTFFLKCTGHDILDLPSFVIKGPAVSMQIGGHTYMSRV